MSNGILGVDSATSNGFVAYLDSKGKVHLPAYPSSMSWGMPMLFMHAKDGKEYAGDQVTARNGLIAEPNSVYQSVKMNLGKEDIRLNGRMYTASDIHIAISNRLLEVSRQGFRRNCVDPEYDTLVVPVPESATAAQRGETKANWEKVKEIASGNIPVILVGEATVLGLAYCYQTTGSTDCSRCIVTADFGGGTTDVAVLRPARHSGDLFDTLAAKSIREAGDNLDQAMLRLALEKLRQSPGSLNMSILEDQTHFAHRRLLAQCRSAKEALSESDTFYLEVHDGSGGYSGITLTKEEYEIAIRPIAERMVNLVEEALKESGLGAQPDVDLVLAGGTAQTPLIQQMLRQRFPWIKEACFTPRLGPQATAMGAALYGACRKKVVTRSAHGYAVRTLDSNNKPKLKVVIPPARELPCEEEAAFRTAWENQTSCNLPVYEITHGKAGELLDVHDGIQTDCTLTHKFPRAVAQNTGIRVSISLDKGGLLTVRAYDHVPGGFVSKKEFTLTNMKTTEAETYTKAQEQPEKHSAPKKEDLSEDEIYKKVWAELFGP